MNRRGFFAVLCAAPTAAVVAIHARGPAARPFGTWSYEAWRDFELEQVRIFGGDRFFGFQNFPVMRFDVSQWSDPCA